MQLSIFNETNAEYHCTKLDITSNKAIFDKVQPFLRYPGSKFRASKYIEPFWKAITFKEYREPFLGCGAVFFRMPKVEFSWLNDFDEDLINTFKVVASKSDRKALIEKNLLINPTKDFFDELKNSKPTNKIDKAYRYFVINRLAYSGIMKQPNFGFHPIKSVQPDMWEKRLQEAGQKLEKNVLITSGNYADIIEKDSGKSTWIFVDPPYFKADQKRAYFHSFTLEDHLSLEKCLRKTNNKFCLTYDNCDEVKKLYSWANIHEVDWMYHTANSNVTTRKIGKELIITNYSLA
jgi:DNA adenine methylase